MTALSLELGVSILGGFAVAWIALGWFWGRHAKTYDDRVLAGRNVGLALGTATAMATWVTTNTTMAAPQFAYQLGVWGMLGYSLAAVGLILFAPLARRIKRLMPRGYTSGDFVRARYGAWAWRVFIVISMIYALGWLVSMGMAGGTLLEALVGLDYRAGMVGITVICVIYTVLGGMHAVIGTDFIQSVLILVGLVVVAIGVFLAVPPATVHEQLAAERPQLLNLLMPASIMFLFNQLLFGVGEIFHSNVWWSRALAFRDGVGHKAFLYGGLAWIPVPIAAGAVALAAPGLGINVPRLDMVGPLVVGSSLGTVGAAVIRVVVLAALASSLDSLLVATADLVVEDLYRGKLRPQASGPGRRPAPPRARVLARLAPRRHRRSRRRGPLPRQAAPAGLGPRAAPRVAARRGPARRRHDRPLLVAARHARRGPQPHRRVRRLDDLADRRRPLLAPHQPHRRHARDGARLRRGPHRLLRDRLLHGGARRRRGLDGDRPRRNLVASRHVPLGVPRRARSPGGRMMTIPAWLFELVIWTAIGLVAVGAVFLLVMLVREWRGGRLW